MNFIDENYEKLLSAYGSLSKICLICKKEFSYLESDSEKELCGICRFETSEQ